MEFFIARNLLILKKITLYCNERAPAPLRWVPPSSSDGAHGWVGGMDAQLGSGVGAAPHPSRGSSRVRWVLSLIFFCFFEGERLFLTLGNKSRLCALNECLCSSGSTAGERTGSGIKSTACAHRGQEFSPCQRNVLLLRRDLDLC